MRLRLSRCANTALWWWAAVALAAARELDPAACGARFDVQRDKIIRTEESREMGARYLSELDVGARHECLRLCCETDSCDVFVYEEKSPGSCYLFNCGPPEDFRCKFTAHGNFSSGVLALSRRLAELQDQERLARHEQPLASLSSLTSQRGATSSTAAPSPGRAPPGPMAALALEHAPASASAPGPAPAPPPPPARPPEPPQGRCSRYQFECRRGSECIAVYNACDGVPQCADGSDEAPELGCPAAASAPAAPERPAPTRPPSPTPESPPPPPPFKPMQAGEGVEGLSAGLLAAGAERWPHRLAQAQPPRRYPGVEEAPHIFAHKGGLVGAGAAPPQYAPFEPPWRRLWPQPPGAEWAPPEAWPEDRRAWPVPPPPPRALEVPMYVPAKTMPEMPPAYSGQQQTLRDAPKKGPSAPPPTAPPTDPPVAPPAAPPRQTPETTSNKKEQHHESGATRGATAGAGAEAEAAAAHADERDGLSDHPPAAILLLVLGVAMTAVLGAMAGCRARAARRRLRRGKAPLAHDADYLVNGMYL